MHTTSLISGLSFSETYGLPGKTVIDIGGLDVNGSLSSFFKERGMKYICVDIEDHHSVDIIIKPGEKLPFENSSIDLIVSTSCFEHDPCFWLTFKEMTRILKMDGFIYISAPSNGYFHGFPSDNWRFYAGAGQALAYWSGKQMANEDVFPVKVVETFHITPINEYEIWIDFVCVWKRVNDKDNNITINQDIVNNIGVLETSVRNKGCNTIKYIQ